MLLGVKLVLSTFMLVVSSLMPLMCGSATYEGVFRRRPPSVGYIRIIYLLLRAMEFISLQLGIIISLRDLRLFFIYRFGGID